MLLLVFGWSGGFPFAYFFLPQLGRISARRNALFPRRLLLLGAIVTFASHRVTYISQTAECQLFSSTTMPIEHKVWRQKKKETESLLSLCSRLSGLTHPTPNLRCNINNWKKNHSKERPSSSTIPQNPSLVC